jgi:thiamine biosynthesis protein ThiS
VLAPGPGRRGAQSMKVTVNGAMQELADTVSVGDLLRGLALAPVRVAVEVNKELVPRGRFDEIQLRNGDAIEIVTFVGGG